MKFEGGSGIIIKVPRARYDATIHFYRDILLMDVAEQPADHPAIAGTYQVKFGNHILRLDCVDHLTEPQVWLEVRSSGEDHVLPYLKTNGIETCDEPEATSGAVYRIRDPSGVTILLSTQTSPSDESTYQANNRYE